MDLGPVRNDGGGEGDKLPGTPWTPPPEPPSPDGGPPPGDGGRRK
ncbi:hypothetical protein ACWCYY_34865 [Kitasatospora sp. NPDC001664]